MWSRFWQKLQFWKTTSAPPEGEALCFYLAPLGSNKRRVQLTEIKSTVQQMQREALSAQEELKAVQ